MLKVSANRSWQVSREAENDKKGANAQPFQPHLPQMVPLAAQSNITLDRIAV
tara:strand:+ start:218 stop:373 length:156 start_codon:yes stop_codon:yes gene_type:complete